MLTDVLTLNNGTADQTFTLISRTGMDSVRRNTTAGVLSSENYKLVIKNTIDDKNKSKPNRHLVLVQKTETDANGVESTCQAHFVITRAKKSTDAAVQEVAAVCSAVASDPTLIAKIIIGGN